MGRLQRAVRTRYPAGFDRIEGEERGRIRFDPAETLERRIGPARIARMRIASLPVRLPDFEQGAVDRRAIAVEQAALDADSLADRVRRHQIAADQLRPVIVDLALLVRRQTGRGKGSDRLRRRDSNHQSLSSGVSLRPRSTMSKR